MRQGRDPSRPAPGLIHVRIRPFAAGPSPLAALVAEPAVYEEGGIQGTCDLRCPQEEVQERQNAYDAIHGVERQTGELIKAFQRQVPGLSGRGSHLPVHAAH